MIPEEYLIDDPYDNDQNDCSNSLDYVYPGLDGIGAMDNASDFQCRSVLQSQVNLLDEVCMCFGRCDWYYPMVSLSTDRRRNRGETHRNGVVERYAFHISER